MKKLLVFGVALLIGNSCASKKGTAIPSAAKAQSSITLSPQQMALAKNLFETRCSKCHALPNPADYSAEKWPGIIDWMGPKAKLNPQEKSWILAYVLDHAKES